MQREKEIRSAMTEPAIEVASPTDSKAMLKDTSPAPSDDRKILSSSHYRRFLPAISC